MNRSLKHWVRKIIFNGFWKTPMQLLTVLFVNAPYLLLITSFRIPGWCMGARVTVNGSPIEQAPRKGFVAVRRRWTAGDVLELNVPMPVRRVASHPRVEGNKGRLAIMRGPMVYCLEDCDNPCAVDAVAIAPDAAVTTAFRPELLDGVVALQIKSSRHELVETKSGGFAYAAQPVELTAVPYYAWDNRQPGRMVVWVPTAHPPAPAIKDATIAVAATPSASHCNPADTPTALNDNVRPKASSDPDLPRLTWWDHRGTKEWVAYEFAKPKRIAKAAVYWFDDSGKGGCRVPESWRLQWWDGGRWQPVDATGAYGVEKDRFNTVSFAPVETTKLRLEVQLRTGMSGGILEWRLPK